MLPEPGNMREAALVIHALGDDDQRTLLGRLSPAERERVAPLLAELQALGIPRDFDVRALLQKLKSDPSPALTGHAANIDYLQRQQPAVILRALANQSPATIALVLDAHAWRWKSEVRAQLAAAIPPAAARRSPIAGKTMEAIVAAMCERCSDIAVHARSASSAVAPRSYWSRFTLASRRLASWNR